MFFFRGLADLAPIQATFQDPATGQQLCQPPAGFTWAGDHWERLKAGEAPKLGPCGATVTTNDTRPDALFVQPGRGAQNPAMALYPQASWIDVYNLNTDPMREARISALLATGTIPYCPASSASPCGASDCYCFAGAPDAETIPGTFRVLGQRFNVGAVNADGDYVATFVPTPDQRALIDRYVIRASHFLYVKDGSAAVLSDKIAGGVSIAQALWDPQSVAQCGPGKSAAIQRTGMQFLSICVPTPTQLATTWLPNFSFNPIQPTNAEMNGADGYRNWAARGGYLIHLPFVTGQQPLQTGLILTFCKSILCNCNGKLSCIAGTVGGSGGPGQPSNTPPVKFDGYLSIEQSAPWRYTLTLKHTDPDWFDRLGGWLADTMIELGSLFCDSSTQSIVNNQINATVSEKCVDKSGKICKKGVPIGGGCTCTGGTDTQRIEAQSAKIAFGAACQAWLSDNPPPPIWDPPIAPQFPTGPVAPPSSAGFWIAALLGLGTGAYLFSRKP